MLSREGMLAASGPGVERVMEEAANRWPVARMIVSRATSSRPRRHCANSEPHQAGDADIIVVPSLSRKATTPEALFRRRGRRRFKPCYRRSARGGRTFQLLHQVTGRQGASVTGPGLDPDDFPEHPVMQAIVTGDREAFYEAEIAMREEAGLPPFGRLAALIISAKTKPEAKSYARALALAAPEARLIQVLGPVEAPLAIIRARHRQRLLVKAAREADLQGYLVEWLSRVDPPRGSLNLHVDVDPHSFL